MFLLKFLWLSYFEKIGGTGWRDGRTDGLGRFALFNAAPREGRIIKPRYERNCGLSPIIEVVMSSFEIGYALVLFV